MTTDYTTSFTVAVEPQRVFDSINHVRAWWGGEIEGPTEHLGDVFSYRYGDFHFSKQEIVESVAAKKIVWRVIEGSINFVDDKSEWTGTSIIFDLSKVDDGTTVTFTHKGLVPAKECFNGCSDAWSSIIGGSLKAYIETGKGDLDALSS